MRVSCFICLAFLSVMSCKDAGSGDTSGTNGAATDLKTLEAQVLTLHDEVMPKMNDINHLNAQLRRITEGFVVTAEERVIPPEGLDEVKEALKMAEHGMWDWMKTYSDTKEGLNEDQLEAFYQSELTKITKVKTDILKAIEDAQAWLAAHPQPQQ